MKEAVPERPRWDLAAESIVVKIRWFGVIMGYVLVQTRTGLHNPSAVRAFLALGAGYAALDFAFWRLGEVFLKRLPLFVSFMESIFIALLCYHDTGLASPFRWYYLLSLICCAIRYQPAVAWWTLGFHSISLLSLAWSLGFSTPTGSAWPLTLVIMAWVTWASSSLAGLLKAAGDQLQDLNSELVRVRAELEERVAERTDALRTSQARMIQQEKMAAFGLLAAGIAHEVGNPLAALSSLVQILKRRGPDPYTSEKLDLAGRQLHRIERTIRELIDFSRPASRAITRTRICEVVDEALGIAKYYQRTKQRRISTDIPTNLPCGSGGSRLPDPGHPESCPERDRRDRRPGADPPAGADRRRLDGAERRGRRPGDLAGRPLPSFSAVLHDQAAWHRAGTFREPSDSRGVLRNADLLLRAGTGLDVHDPASLGSRPESDSDGSERRGSRGSGSGCRRPGAGADRPRQSRCRPAVGVRRDWTFYNRFFRHRALLLKHGTEAAR